MSDDDFILGHFAVTDKALDRFNYYRKVRNFDDKAAIMLTVAEGYMQAGALKRPTTGRQIFEVMQAFEAFLIAGGHIKA